MSRVLLRNLEKCLLICLLLILSSIGSFAANQPQGDQFSGALNYSVPIEVPPGRNGMQPNLALSYHSGRGNGWVGVGWDLSVGAITRNTQSGLDYNGNDYLFNGGELIETSPNSGVYQAKFENEFNHIIKHGSGASTYWEVTDKTGKRYLYGQFAESRQDDPADSSRIFKWCLDKVVDTHGNYMTYSYIKDQRKIFLEQIDYAGNESEGVAPAHSVKFYNENRDDSSPMSKRLKRVDISALGKLERSYKFEYDAESSVSGEQYSPSTHRSILRSVQQLGDDIEVDSTSGELLNESQASKLSSEQFSYKSSNGNVNSSTYPTLGLGASGPTGATYNAGFQYTYSATIILAGPATIILAG